MKTDNGNRGIHGRMAVDARLRYQFFVFIVCLIASISFWLLIKLSNDYTLSFTIPVQFTNVPDHRFFKGASDSSVQVSLKAQGYKLVLLRYLQHPQPLTINLAQQDLHPKSAIMIGDIPMAPAIRRYTAALGFVSEVKAIHPEKIAVRLDRLFKKRIPVAVATDLTFAPQYLQFDTLTVEPSTVTVLGTREMVDSVKVATPEVIKLRKLNEGVVRFLSLNANRKNNRPYFIPSKVKVTIPVQKFTEESLQVPIKIPVADRGQAIRIFPDKATISCIVAMKDYQKLDSRLFTVSAVLEKSDHRYHLQVTSAPVWVRNVKVTPDKVEYLLLRQP